VRKFRFSLTVSILAFLSCLLLLTWLLFSVLAFKTAANDLYAQKGEHARMLLTAFVSQLPETIPTFPEGMLAVNSPAAVYAQKLSENSSFVRLTLLDVNGKPIFTLGKDSNDVYKPFSVATSQKEGSLVTPDGGSIIHIIPVQRNGTASGSAGLIMSLATEEARLSRSRQLLMAYFAIDFILLLGLGSFILTRIMVRPINRLLAATEKITGGQYGHQVRVAGSSELSQLAESFNEMSSALKQKELEVRSHVDALEKANSELKQAREEAIRTEKMASIGLLAAGMAHEIGTPLASIMGYAELAAGEQLESTVVSDYARRISDDCSRIDRIVRGLLDYSRPRGSSLQFCDVGALVTETIELVTRQGACKGVNLSARIDQAALNVLLDPHQLQQVLINLILNSRDALAPDGKIQIRVKVSLKDDSPGPHDQVQIDVIDNGCGITEEHIGKIFDPFFTTKQPGKGTGLGLAISARIIESLGGKIRVQSKAGTGTCFTILLPLHAEKGAQA
jgi:signal transduction histidine kinase